MHPEFRFPHAQRAAAESADNAQRAGQASTLVQTTPISKRNERGAMVYGVRFAYADGTTAESW